MAVYANTTNQIAALKELYPPDSPFMEDLVYKKNPMFALIPKADGEDGFPGKYMPIPVVFGTPQGRSATFTNAQGNQTAPLVVAFNLTRVKNYALATIENELLEATKSNIGAFVKEAKLVNDTSIRNISNDLAADLYRAGYGIRGASTAASTQSGTTASGTVLPLGTAADIVQFEVGMVLVAVTAAGGTPSTDTVTVTKVDRQLGVVTGTASAATLSGNWGIGSAVAYLGVQGDMANAQMLKVAGLQAWLPSTAPTTGDNFFGVDRSVDPTRLGGIRYDGSAQPIEEALIDGCSLVAREGGEPSMCFTSFASYAALEKSLGAKVQYVSVKHDEADIAFDGITINSPYGPIQVMPDRNCPAKTAYLLDMSTWKFRSLGKAPHLLNPDGLDGLRVSNADAIEMRWGYYGNLACSAPGWNAVIALSV